MNIFEQVEKNINELVENNVNWSACATAEEMQRAREGRLSIKFFDKEVPTDWLKEVSRILKVGGSFIMMAPNPINYLCDFVEDKTGGYYKAVNRMPYCSSDHDSMRDWVEYGHTMEDYIGGQIECGLVINGYVECQLEDITELHFLTRAVKVREQ